MQELASHIQQHKTYYVNEKYDDFDQNLSGLNIQSDFRLYT